MDSKGFIRFANDEFFTPRVNKLEKMFGFNGTMPNWYPSENNPAYEKYPYKNFTGNYLNPYIACPAEVFCYRYFKLWKKFIKENPWMRISYINREGDRKCMTICVFRFNWKNGPYHQVIEFTGVDVDGNRVCQDIRLDELSTICVHVCTKDEQNRLMDMLNETIPEPYIPIFKIDKELYSKNYDLYLSDCKSCGVKPLPLEMIERATQDIYILVENGCITGMCDDYYIVNSLPTSETA